MCTTLKSSGSGKWHRFSGQRHVEFKKCVFNVKHKGDMIWNNVQLGSGFDVCLIYSKKCCVDGDHIGLTYDFELNSVLARFLLINSRLVSANINTLENIIQSYRMSQNTSHE